MSRIICVSRFSRGPLYPTPRLPSHPAGKGRKKSDISRPRSDTLPKTVPGDPGRMNPPAANVLPRPRGKGAPYSAPRWSRRRHVLPHPAGEGRAGETISAGKNHARNFPQTVCLFTHRVSSARFLPSPVLFPCKKLSSRKGRCRGSLYWRGKFSAPFPPRANPQAQNNRSAPSPPITVLAQNLLSEKARWEIITVAG